MLKLIKLYDEDSESRFKLEKDGKNVGTANTTCIHEGKKQLTVDFLEGFFRKDDAKYFLKQLLHQAGGYQDTSIEVWIPQNHPIGEIYCALGFEKTEVRNSLEHWERQQKKQLTSLKFSHDLLYRYVQKGDFVIDATAGNGGDTELLSRLVGPKGKVLALDIQKAAVEATRRRLVSAGLSDRAILVCQDHAKLAQLADEGSVAVIVFNFGWLPGGDHHIFTTPRSSIPALESALKLLKSGGRLIASLYHGGMNGNDEKNTLLQWFQSLDSQLYTVMVCRISNREGKDPIVILTEKR